MRESTVPSHRGCRRAESLTKASLTDRPHVPGSSQCRDPRRSAPSPQRRAGPPGAASEQRCEGRSAARPGPSGRPRGLAASRGLLPPPGPALPALTCRTRCRASTKPSGLIPTGAALCPCASSAMTRAPRPPVDAAAAPSRRSARGPAPGKGKSPPLPPEVGRGGGARGGAGGAVGGGAAGSGGELGAGPGGGGERGLPVRAAPRVHLSSGPGGAGPSHVRAAPPDLGCSEPRLQPWAPPALGHAQQYRAALPSEQTISSLYLT